MIPARCLILSSVFVVYPLGIGHLAWGQIADFGVITGSSLTDDFRNATRTSLGNSSFTVTNASRPFIIGPKVEIHISKSLSVELDALHREIRTRNTWHSVFSPPLQLPDGTTLSSTTYSTVGTEFAWEFPVLARYRFSAAKIRPVIEAGPSFRPAENRELYGITAGTGIESQFHALRLSPRLRYTRWRENGKYLGAVQDQLQFVLGIDRSSASETVSVFGLKASFGATAGWGVTDNLKIRSSSFTDPRNGEVAFLEGLSLTRPIAGIMIDIKLPESFSLEMDCLYRPLNARDVTILSNGTVSSQRRFTVLTWEFPVLAKYRLPRTRPKPFVELGPSLRGSGNLNGARPSHEGITAGVGIELGQRRVTFSPTIRYTRWRADDKRTGPQTLPDQVEVLVGFSF